MKKSILYGVILFICIFTFTSGVSAVNEKKYTHSDHGEFTIDKDSMVSTESGSIVGFKLEKSKASFKGIEVFETSDNFIMFYTDANDPAVLNKDNWWATLYACKTTEIRSVVPGAVLGGITGIIITKLMPTDAEYSIYTSQLLTSLITSDPGLFETLGNNIFGGEETICDTFEVEGVQAENQVNYCSILSQISVDIGKWIKMYKADKSITYINNYRRDVNRLKEYCNQGFASANYNDPCILACLGLNNMVSGWDKQFGISNGTGKCGFSDRIIEWILNVYRWIKYIIPVAVIVLGIIDFIKAIAGSSDDAMKKAQSRFIKRLIAAALIFIIPFIIEFVLDKFGFTDYVNGCGIVDL